MIFGCSIFVLGGIVFGATIINDEQKQFAPSAYAENIFEECKTDMHCAIDSLNNINKINDEYTMDVFSELIKRYDQSPYPCHETSHHLGMWLVGHTSLEKSIEIAKQQCGGGIFHGIFQNYLAIENIQNKNPEQINIDLCPIDVENQYSIFRWQCLHGIGHGLTILYDYDVSSAVQRCEEFKHGFEQISCSKGVFMQNVGKFFDNKGGNFDSENLMYPCNNEEKFAPSCYHYHASVILLKNEFDVEKSFADCSTTDYANYCYHGIGRQLSDQMRGSIARAQILCQDGEQPVENTSSCLRGMVMTLINRNSDMDSGFQFCSIVNESYKTDCYDALGKWLIMLYSSDEKRSGECLRSESFFYQDVCNNASVSDITLL